MSVYVVHVFGFFFSCTGSEYIYASCAELLNVFKN